MCTVFIARCHAAGGEDKAGGGGVGGENVCGGEAGECWLEVLWRQCSRIGGVGGDNY